MDDLLRRWLQALESAGPDNPGDCIDAIGGRERYGEDLVTIYERSGNRIFLLELFTVLAREGTDGTIALPKWLFGEVSRAFAGYLESVTRTQDEAPLESFLGITKEMKEQSRNAYMGREQMVVQVHKLRYYFELDVQYACAVVHELNRSRLPQLTGSAYTDKRRRESFYDNYSRNYSARGFPDWKKQAIARGDYPSPIKQEQILRVLGDALAKKVKRYARLRLIPGW